MTYRTDRSLSTPLTTPVTSPLTSPRTPRPPSTGGIQLCPRPDSAGSSLSALLQKIAASVDGIMSENRRPSTDRRPSVDGWVFSPRGDSRNSSTPKPGTPYYTQLIGKFLGDEGKNPNTKIEIVSPTSMTRIDAAQRVVDAVQEFVSPYNVNEILQNPECFTELSLQNSYDMSVDANAEMLSSLAIFTNIFPNITTINAVARCDLHADCLDLMTAWPLTRLNIAGSALLLCEDPSILKKFQHLTTLNVSNCNYSNGKDGHLNISMTDEILDIIADIPTLEDLDISWSPDITDIGVCKLFENLKNLKKIKISYCPNVDINNVLSKLVSKDFELEEIDLSNTTIDDMGLLNLGGFSKTLKKVHLNCVSVTQSGIHGFLTKNPKVMIVSEDESIKRWVMRFQSLRQRTSRTIVKPQE